MSRAQGPGFVLLALALHLLVLALASGRADTRHAPAPPAAAQRVQLRALPGPATETRQAVPTPAGTVRPAADAVLLAPQGGAGRPAADAWAAYMPRSQLSLAPQPSTPPLLEWPEFDGELEHYAGELALYIDETGRVQRVLVQGKTWPAPLAEAARRAFVGLSFRPGELDGRPVKSLIHVEVSFEQPARAGQAGRGIGP